VLTHLIVLIDSTDPSGFAKTHRTPLQPSCDNAVMQRIHGHQTAIQRLQRTINSGRMHHAWIISGPRGVGKRLLAEETARVLLDPDASADELGSIDHQQSHVSKLMESGTHPDLHVIHRRLAATSSVSTLRDRKQMNIPVDLLRETVIGGRTSDGKIHEAAAYRTATLGCGKIFIIDEAERLDLPGQNLLLKTLEEPPSSTWFFLLTNNPDGLLPTISSRCQHLNLSPLDQSEMLGWIESQEIECDPEDLDVVIQFANGSPGMFDLALKRSLVGWIHSMDEIAKSLGSGSWNADMSARMHECIELWANQVLEDNSLASKSSANQEGADMVIRMLSDSVRHCLRHHTQTDDLLRNCGVIDLLHETEQQIRSGLNIKHVLESMTAEWCASK